MKFNLTEKRRVYSDAGPYKVLTEDNLQLLVDGVTDTTGLAVTAETLAIICDLGVRHRLDSLVYYRNPATTENITVHGKQGPGNDFVWEELPMLPGAGKVTVDFTAAASGASFNAESAHFERSSSQHASVADTTVFDVSAMTIECWLRPDDLPSTGAILGKLGPSNGTYSFWIRTVNTTEIQVAFSTDGTSTGAYISQPHGLTLLNTWHHIAATWDGSTGAVIIYVDGVALAAPVTLLMGTIYNSSAAFAVGRLGDHPELSDTSMSEVRIWGVVRTPAEIQDNMFSIASGSESGLLVAYHLDGNFNDSGPNALHLTAVNGPTYTTDVPWGGQPVAGHFEQLKILHTVTTGTATVYELEIWTDEEHILFGPTGEQPLFSVDSGTNTLFAEPVQVYNPEVISADFYCLIDADSSYPHNISLGDNILGPFYDLYETGISIPADVPWASGHLQNVVEISDTLTLVTGTYGVYYTPVIDIDTVSGRRLFWQATVTGTTAVDDPSRNDSVSTVGVRFSDTIPTDGGWSTGQLSLDTNWSVVSGTLPFEPHDNNHILDLAYKRYFQVKVELTAPVSGDTPFLEKVGIEQAIKVTVPPQSYQEVYVKSNSSEHVSGSTTGIVVWSPENRNIGQ